MALTRTVKRWKRNMDVSDDREYVESLATLSTGSVRRHFDPYTDIDWDAPEFSVTPDDPRWVLPTADPLGRHPWYAEQPLDKRIAIGMWRQANVAKVSLHLESILVRGLMQYTFWLPNGSPEYRYCLHESVEECNHTMMFQELVNRIGADVPGMPRWLRWLSPLLPLTAGPLPIVFFFGVLAGEAPIDHLQKATLRDPKSLHPVLEKVMAIHVAEEARHISFAHEYLRKRVPHMPRRNRFWLSLFVPIMMRVMCQAIVVPPRSFFRDFDIPRSVRKGLFVGLPVMTAAPVRDLLSRLRKPMLISGLLAAGLGVLGVLPNVAIVVAAVLLGACLLASTIAFATRSTPHRQTPCDMFADARMLCEDVGLMNPFPRLMWRLCGIDGRPSRYRGEPQNGHRPTGARPPDGSDKS